LMTPPAKITKSGSPHNLEAIEVQSTPRTQCPAICDSDRADGSAAGRGANEEDQPPEKRMRLMGKQPTKWWSESKRYNPEVLQSALDAGLEDDVIEELKQMSKDSENDEVVSTVSSEDVPMTPGEAEN
jgi:hypothetical protein